ncbi:MAG: hypothetical protein J3R72DRAFT_471772 [Linnemannia gamsii]|nr:MAG: hypothetical protein J3R72DRAFT_471772 [Linnemannia gamsii]
MAVLQALVEPRTKENMNTQQPSDQESASEGEGGGGDHHRNLVMFSEFTGSLVGFFAFLVFGTTRDALETMGKVVCFPFGRCRDEECKQQGLQDIQQGQQRQQGLGYGFEANQDNSGCHKDGRANHPAHNSNDIFNNSTSNRNYTDMYLGNNNTNTNDDHSDYGYPCSDSSLSSTQLRDNNGFANHRYEINHHRSSRKGGKSTDTIIANAIATTMNDSNTTTASSSSSNNCGNSYLTRKESTNTTITTISNSHSRQISIPNLVVVGPIPPPPLKPLPEKPTFQELMMYDFYHNNKSSNSKSSNSKSKNSRRGRRHSNSRDDLESGLQSDLLQPPPPSPSPRTLLPPRSVYSHK